MIHKAIIRLYDIHRLHFSEIFFDVTTVCNSENSVLQLWGWSLGRFQPQWQASFLAPSVRKAGPMLANGEYGDAFVDSRHLWTLWKFHVQMQCTRASPHRDSGTMSAWKIALNCSMICEANSSCRRSSPPFTMTAVLKGIQTRMEEKNVHCIARERKEESRKPMQLWDSLGEKKHHFLVEMVPQQKSRKDGKLLYYWDLLRFIGFRQASVSSWHSGYRGCCLDPVHLGGRLEHKTLIGEIFVFI